jgi:hypothetical protein
VPADHPRGVELYLLHMQQITTALAAALAGPARDKRLALLLTRKQLEGSSATSALNARSERSSLSCPVIVLLIRSSPVRYFGLGAHTNIADKYHEARRKARPSNVDRAAWASLVHKSTHKLRFLWWLQFVRFRIELLDGLLVDDSCSLPGPLLLGHRPIADDVLPEH